MANILETPNKHNEILTYVFTPEKRSWIMSQIRGTNIKIDLKMKDILDAMGFPYEMYPKMYGNPDFILTEKKIAIFCDGDFWHGNKFHEKKSLQKSIGQKRSRLT